MNAVVVYDSLYGNTEKIAQAIGAGLAGAIGTSGSVLVAHVGVIQPNQLGGLDLLVAGAPTHGSHPSPAMNEFLNHISEQSLAGVKVAAFDTRTDMDKLEGAAHFFGKIFDHFGYAAPRILAGLEKKGGHAGAPGEGFIVLDKEGPLREGELERASAWAAQLVSERQVDTVHS